MSVLVLILTIAPVMPDVQTTPAVSVIMALKEMESLVQVSINNDISGDVLILQISKDKISNFVIFYLDIDECNTASNCSTDAVCKILLAVSNVFVRLDILGMVLPVQVTYFVGILLMLL